MTVLPLKAQIIIKDTVVISPEQKIKSESGHQSPTGTDTFLVAPRSGVLAIMPKIATKMTGPLPSGSYFSFQLPDTTYTPYLLPFFSYHDSGGQSYRNCTWPGQFYMRNYYCPSETTCGDYGAARDTFYTRPIQTGDTLRFSFYGEFENVTRSVERLWPPGIWTWRIEIATCYDAFGDHEQASEWCMLYVSFADTLVKFTRPDSAVVYPYYPAIRNDTVTVGPKKRYIDLELRVEFADSAIPNYWARIDTSHIRGLEPADSGGHAHSHVSPRRPVGKYRYPINTTTQLDAITAKTDSTGKIKFRFLASQFGGVESIRAWLVSDTTKWDTLSVKTRVPGLMLLPEGNHYIKIGGTCRHHGPSDNSEVPDSCRSPDDNHWANPSVVVWFDSVARKYKREFNPPHNIKYNDISLPLGGGFDISGQWETDIRRGTLTGHRLHRVGKSVDVRTNPPNADGVPIARKLWLQEKLYDFDRNATVRIHSPGTDNQHFHFQFTEE